MGYTEGGDSGFPDWVKAIRKANANTQLQLACMREHVADKQRSQTKVGQ